MDDPERKLSEGVNSKDTFLVHLLRELYAKIARNHQTIFFRFYGLNEQASMAEQIWNLTCLQEHFEHECPGVFWKEYTCSMQYIEKT